MYFFKKKLKHKLEVKLASKNGIERRDYLCNCKGTFGSRCMVGIIVKIMMIKYHDWLSSCISLQLSNLIV